MNAGALLGAYRVIRRIGSGGMGEVWEAQHKLLGRRAAIKVLHPSFSVQPEVVSRFFNEARAATSISDPGIVQIFDFGHHVDGSAYIVMELLEGETLEQRLRRHGALPPTEALRIIRQVASSLAAAHARGIVHRDLKPENLFMVADHEVASGERVKIVDFGIAKLVGDDTVKTHTSAVMGTPMFMSPEQCRGAGQVDQRSDVYSLGCVLFTLLTGRAPFRGDGVGDIIAMHLREPAPAPSSQIAGIAPEVDQLVLRCMAKDSAQRPSATELATAIAGMIGVSSAAGAVPPHRLPTMTGPAATAGTTLSASARAAIPARRSAGKVYAAGAAIIVALAGGTAWLALRKPSAQPIAAASPAVTPPVPRLPEAAVALPIRGNDQGNDQAKNQLRDALSTFATWSRDHLGAPCPDATTLALDHDPWSQAIRITCSDQPADQIIGAISAGPDRVFGTSDDLQSWTLGSEVSKLVQGPRWTAKASAPAEHRSPARSSRRSPSKGGSEATVAKPEPAAVKPEPPSPAKRSKGLDRDGDGIPDVR
jgi:Protein kinase domain